MKRRLFALLAALLLLLNGCAPTGGEGSKGILVRVQNGSATAWLLGSIHIGNEAMYPFGEAILAAIRDADTFVYECDASGADAARLMRQRMALPEGEGLSDYVSAKTLSLLEQVCARMGASMDDYAGMRPWAVTNALSLASTAAQLGVRDVSGAVALGVERQVEKQRVAIHRDAPVEYLESVEQQIELMDGMSAELQEYLLAEACETILAPEGAAGVEGDIRMWPTWWRNGDTEAFAKSYRQAACAPGREALYREYHERFVTRRNADMAEAIARLMERNAGGTIFVTLGLMHLALPGDSVVENLRAMGYTVVEASEGLPRPSSANASSAGMGLAK